MENTRFETLPADVQAKVKDTLKAFPAVTVYFEYGEYHTMTGCCIRNKYADDHKVLGRYTDKEIFTEEERTENYIETFHDYPIWYKGKRDYKALRERFGY